MRSWWPAAAVLMMFPWHWSTSTPLPWCIVPPWNFHLNPGPNWGWTPWARYGEVWATSSLLSKPPAPSRLIGQLWSACRFGSRPVHAMIIDPWPWWQLMTTKSSLCLVVSLWFFMSLISIEHYWTVWLVTSLKFWSVALYDLSIMNYLCGRPRQSKPLLCSLSFMTWVSPSPVEECWATGVRQVKSEGFSRCQNKPWIILIHLESIAIQCIPCIIININAR